MKDKRLVVGSSQLAESTVLPLHFLKLQGVKLKNVKLVSLDKDFDKNGNPCASPQHVLQALRDHRGEAGIITDGLWNRLQKEPATKGVFQQVWTSPTFSHCVFTADTKFDERLARKFTKLMTTMDPKDPKCADVMRLEGTKKWLPGSPNG